MPRTRGEKLNKFPPDFGGIFDEILAVLVVDTLWASNALSVAKATSIQ